MLGLSRKPVETLPLAPDITIIEIDGGTGSTLMHRSGVRICSQREWNMGVSQNVFIGTFAEFQIPDNQTDQFPPRDDNGQVLGNCSCRV